MICDFCGRGVPRGKGLVYKLAQNVFVQGSDVVEKLRRTLHACDDHWGDARRKAIELMRGPELLKRLGKALGDTMEVSVYRDSRVMGVARMKSGQDAGRAKRRRAN